MRVVLDARMAGATGIGRYVRELVRHLAGPGDTGRAHAGLGLDADLDPDLDLEVLVAVNPGDPMAWLPASDRVRPVCFRRRIPPFSWREQWSLAGELRRFAPDVVHAPNWNAPLGLGVPLVVTFHDLIYYHFAESCPSRIAHWYARWALRRMARGATHILAVSQATADETVRVLGADPGRITVVHHGLPLPPDPDAPVGALPAGVTPPFALYVGTWAPHKNLPILVEAVAVARRAGSALQLVIAGAPGRHAASVERAIAAHGLTAAVHRVGRVDDPTLRALYRDAVALALPSRMEGFGFTPLEAFAHGCAVVASDIPSIREVAGAGARLVPANDAAALAGALQALERDPADRAALVAQGRARLAAFSWERAADATAQVYRRAAGAGSTRRPAPPRPNAPAPVR